MVYNLTMRSDAVETVALGARTFTETARRAQIVAAAIDTIAELGYTQASLARIAERLEISKGVILYHFAGKDELVQEVIAEVLAKGEAYMRRRIQAEPAGAGKLRAYIESNLGFMGEYRNHVVAIVDISRTARGADGSWIFDRAVLDKGAARLRQLLADLQASGELRTDFDPAIMALTIRAAIDAAGAQLAREPELDIDHFGGELASLFERATHKELSPPKAGS
jgi:TetR/AcrR family transcriptional regulator, fatty acid metabolism regulator protein